MPEKNYNELIKGRIYIGGADDVQDVMENEKADVIYDLRAEAPKDSSEFNCVHTPIVDDQEKQDASIKNAIDHVINAYHEGKKVYMHCGGGSNRTGTVAIGTLLSLGEAKSIDEAEGKAQSIRPKIKLKPEMKEALTRLFPNAQG